jgi:PAS domain S-box-containing protein
MVSSPVNEPDVHALRRALGNMAALSSLPAMWVGADEPQIAETLADALFRVLDLDGVRIKLWLATEPIEVERISASAPAHIGSLLHSGFPNDGAAVGTRDLVPNGSIRGFSIGIGTTGADWLYAVAERADFPTEAERLALVMSVNQAAVAWQRARAEQALRTQTEVLDRERHAVSALNRTLANERDRLRLLFQQAPGFMAILHGPQHIFEMCNESYFRLIGRRDVAGRPARQVFPDLEGQPFFKLLDQVYATGKAHVSTAAPIDLLRTPGGMPERRYLDFIYQPIFDDGVVSGIFAEGHDITDLIKAQEQLALSEESLRLATSAAEIGTWDLDLELGALNWCVRTKAMFGIAPEVPCSMADFYAGLHPDDLAATSEAFAAATDANRRSTYDVEYRTVGKEDGALRWVAAKGKGLFRDGRCVRAIGTAIDITARKDAEARLRRSQSELREFNRTLEARVEEQSRERARIWSNSRDIHVVITPNKAVRAVNPAWRAILGQDTEDVIGRSVMEFGWPEDGDAISRAFDRAAAGEDLTNFEARLRHTDGSARWISWHTSGDGDLIYAYGRDVTTEKRQTAALREAEEHLRHSQKMEAIGQLTGGVAHDFNNLLTIIRGSADLLRLHDLPEAKRRHYVEAISETADRAAKLTAQLLAFARRQALRPQVFNVAERLHAVSQMLKSVLGSRVALEFNIADDSACVEADVSQFETTLVNLAANARDAMDAAGRMTIRVGRPSGSIVDSPAYLAIAVSDTGCGIPPDRLGQIFEPFFTTKQAGQGTGLGLSQVYGFVQQSGGKIAVQSHPGQGTVFTISLPISSKPAERIETRNDASDTHPRQQGCVLMVEDNPEVRVFSSQLLNEIGYETVLAASGEEALEILLQSPNRFDLVFSDVVMAGMGGVALGEEIRRQFPGLPVVLTSGYSHVLAKGGPHGFELLHKPYTVEDLSNVLQEAMSRRLIGKQLIPTR